MVGNETPELYFKISTPGLIDLLLSTGFDTVREQGSLKSVVNEN